MINRLVLALAAALLAVIFVLLPVERQAVEYVWEPAVDGPRVPLLLIARTPDELALTFPCELAADGDRQLFVSSREPDTIPSLFVRVGESRIVAEVPKARDEPAGERIGTGIDLPTGAGCVVSIRYQRMDEQLVVESAGDSSLLDVPDGAFELTGLHWTSDLTRGVRAEVHTSATSMVRNSLPQKLALAAVALLALASLLPVHRRRSGPSDAVRRAPRGRSWWRRAGWWRRLHPSEWAIILVTVAVALVDLPRIDDGRVLFRARNLAGTDLGPNVSNFVDDRVVPQRWLYEWVLGTSVGWSSSVLVIRLLPALAMVAAWMLLRRRVLPCLANGRATTPMLATAWAVYAVFVVAWSATLRPEPLVVFLTVVVLAVTASWPEQPRVWPSVVVVAAVGVAATTHVAGLAAAFAAFPAAIRALRDLRRSAMPVLTGVAWGGALSLVALALGSNLSHIVAAARSFREGPHSYGVLDVLRYVSAIGNSPAPMMLATGLGLVGAGVALAAAVRRLDGGAWSPATSVVVGAALSPVALFLTPSKWLWHLAILAPVAVVGWTLVARRLESRRVPAMAMLALVGTTLGLLTAWAMRPVWNDGMLTKAWQDTSLRVLSPEGWAKRVPWLFGEEVRWWAWLLLLWAALGGMLLLARAAGRFHGLATSSWPLASVLLACFAAVSVVQLTPPVVDAFRADGEWTFVRQSVVGLVSTEAACGVPAATPAVVQRAEESDDPRLGALDGTIAGHSVAYMYAPCHQPMHQRDGVWQVSPLLMGKLTHDQKRVALEYDVELIGCNSFPRERAGDRLCLYALVADGDPLTPAAIHWHR